MNKSFLLLSLLLLNFSRVSAQDRHVIFFSDKSNSPYSVSSPQQFLSQRAIDRRVRQGIAVNSGDLPVNPQYVQGVAALGANILCTSRWFNAAIVQLSNPADLTSILALPYVSGSQNVGIVRPGNPDKKFGEIKHHELPKPGLLRNSLNSTASLSYGFAYDQTDQIKLTDLHNAGYTGDGMLIAVLDAGFLDLPLMTCFDHLRNENRIVATHDFVANEADVYNDHYHGAAVLSCMAAFVPDTFIGTAPQASYLLLRSEDAATEFLIEEYNWAAAAEYADSAGADIINSSLGYTLFDDSLQNHSYATMNGDLNPISIAADQAAARGMIVVNSAGNEGNSNWNYISAPADADSILAIGAVDQSGLYASFSGNGPSYDGRVKPDVSARGFGTWLYSPYSANQAVQGNGTSFSSPVLAGAVACLWQSHPQTGNMDVVQIIKRSASQYFLPDTLIGYGIPNFSVAGNLLGINEQLSGEINTAYAFPNPGRSDDDISLVYFAGSAQSATFSVYDVTGRMIQALEAPVSPGQHNLIKIPSINAAGTFLIQIDEAGSRRTIKLVLY